MIFVSPSEGRLDLEQAYRSIMNFVLAEPEMDYRLIVGTDSQVREMDICFVTALVVYRQGKGGRYYYHRENEQVRQTLPQRVFYETTKSLELADELTHLLTVDPQLANHLQVEIHLDVGEQGKTQELIKEVVGMVTGCGYNARIKPDSFGASKVADKYTK
jgi:predicted RNase H-related nuclease YkuK (DUF458 family)